MNDKVSVIMPIFNSRKYLKEAVFSVLHQTYENLELILIDDCSTDGSYEIAKELAENDDRITLRKLKVNKGAAVARNAAIKAATGRYIAFLDSDDIWLPAKLDAQIKFMESRNLPFVYSAYFVINELSEIVGEKGVPAQVDYSELLKTNYVGCLTAIYDKNYFGVVEMPLIRKRQDYGLWLKLLKKINYAYGVNVPLAKYRLRADSNTANKFTASKFTWRLYREIEKMSYLKALFFFFNFLMRSLLRNKFPKLAKYFGFLHVPNS